MPRLLGLARDTDLGVIQVKAEVQAWTQVSKLRSHRTRRESLGSTPGAGARAVTICHLLVSGISYPERFLSSWELSLEAEGLTGKKRGLYEVSSLVSNLG